MHLYLPIGIHLKTWQREWSVNGEERWWWRWWWGSAVRHGGSDRRIWQISVSAEYLLIPAASICLGPLVSVKTHPPPHPVPLIPTLYHPLPPPPPPCKDAGLSCITFLADFSVLERRRNLLRANVCSQNILFNPLSFLHPLYECRRNHDIAQALTPPPVPAPVSTGTWRASPLRRRASRRGRGGSRGRTASSGRRSRLWRRSSRAEGQEKPVGAVRASLCHRVINHSGFSLDSSFAFLA